MSDKKPPGSERLKQGRVMVKVENHPEFGTGWIRKSHLVYFENTGIRPDWKKKREIIHHRDGNKSNDAFENLELKTQAEHARDHGPPMLGRKHSIETRDQMSEAHLARHR